jgi:hypothetical protein
MNILSSPSKKFRHAWFILSFFSLIAGALLLAVSSRPQPVAAQTAAVPTITSITPTTGITTGNTTITLKGTNLYPIPQSPAPTVTTVASNHNGSCAQTSDGQVYCWGWASLDAAQGNAINNGYSGFYYIPALIERGALPDGPVQKLTVNQVSGGNQCAIASDGQAYCWGNNWSGKLGNNSTTSTGFPVKVKTTTDSNNGGSQLPPGQLALMSGSDNHVCAVHNNGSLYCWGYNGYGQLGDGTATSQSVPIKVKTKTDDINSDLPAGKIKSLAVSVNHSCVIGPDDRAYCWGYNGNSELGNGTTTNSSLPKAVTTDLTFTKIQTGRKHSCGLATDSKIYCWGSNVAGNFGNGTTNPAAIPVLGGNNMVFSNFWSMAWNTCGNSNNVLYCWGAGYPGDGTTANANPLPKAVKTGIMPPGGAKDVSVGGGHQIIADGAGRNFINIAVIGMDDKLYVWGATAGPTTGPGCYDTCQAGNQPSPVTFPAYPFSVKIDGWLCGTHGLNKNGTTLTCLTQAHAAGSYDVEVNVNGTTLTAPAKFTYATAAPPTLTGLTANARSNMVRLSWNAAPLSTGEQPVRYHVEYKPTSGTTWSNYTAPAGGNWRADEYWAFNSTNIDVVGLTNNTSYDFRVRACYVAWNNCVYGEYTNISATPVATSNIPDKPVVNVVSSSRKVVLTWTAPNNNGSDIQNYVIFGKASNNSVWLPFNRGLTTTTGFTYYNVSIYDALAFNGTTYNFRIAAVNENGVSAWAEVNGTPLTTPNAPSTILLDLNTSTATLSWTAPSGQGGTIDAYRVDYATDPEFDNIVGGCDTDANTRTCTTAPLTGGVTYYFRIKAHNESTDNLGNGVGWSLYSPVKSITGGAPARSNITSATAVYKQITVNWSETANNNSNLTGYVLEYSTNAEFTEDTTTSVSYAFASGNQSKTITGLTNGTTYYFRLLAKNALGNGPYSEVKSATPINGAATVTALTAPAANTWYGGTKKTIAVASTVKDQNTGSTAVDAQTIYYRVDGTAGAAGTAFNAGDITLTTSNTAVSFDLITNDITALSEGSHTLYVWAQDKIETAAPATYPSPTKSNEVSVAFKIDKTAPLVEATGASSSWQVSVPTVTLTASDTGSGLSAVRYGYVALGAATPLNATCTSGGTALSSTQMTQLASGGVDLPAPPDDNTLYLCAVDNVGNVGTRSGDYKIDGTKPTVSATLASSTWSKTIIQPVITATDDGGSGLGGVRYQWGGTNPFTNLSTCKASGTATSHNATLTNAPAGGTTLWLCAYDNIGNFATSSGAYNWENTLPVCGTWTPSPAPWKQSGTQTFTLAGSTDAGGAGINTAGGNCTTGAANGDTCDVIISDKAGNTQTCTSPGNRLDVTKPTLTLNNADGTNWYNSVRTATLTTQDTEAGLVTVRYAWNSGTNISATTCTGGTAVTGFSANQTTTFTSAALSTPSAGDNTLHVCVIDGVGNITYLTGKYMFDTSSNFTCGTWTPASSPWKKTAVGQAFTLAGSTTTNASGMNTTGGNCTTGTAHSATCAVSISDKAGNTTTCTSPINNVDTLAPTISATGAATGWVNAQASGIATYSDSAAAGSSGMSGISRAAYAWDSNTLAADCSGGTAFTSSGQTFQAPSTPGTHTLYLCVKDNAGNTDTYSGQYNWETTAPVCGTWTPASAPWKQDGTQAFTLAGSTDAGGSNIKTAGGNCTTGAANGDTCSVTIEDNAGNTTTCTSPINRVDTTAPTCGTWTPAIGAWHNGATGTMFTLTGSTDVGGAGLNSASSGNLECTTGAESGADCSVTLQDNAGNTTTCTSPKNQLDTTAPVCGTWTPAIGAWHSDETGTTFTLSGSTDAGGAGLDSTSSNSQDCTTGTAHSATCTVTLKDVAGNATTCTSPINNVDTLPPTISATGAGTSWNNTQVSGVVTFADSAAAGSSGMSGVARAAYSWDIDTLGADCSGGTAIATTGQTLLAPATPGAHALYLCVKDNVGNVGTNSGAYNWEVTAPTCGTWTPSSAPWKQSGTQAFTLAGSTDAGGAGINTVGGNCTTGAANGDTCDVIISDKAGNTTTCTSPKNQIDTTAPVCGSWTPADPIAWKNIETVNSQVFTLTDSTDEMGGSGMAAASFECTAEATNSATCSATIRDSAGNTTVCGPSPANRIDLDRPTVAIEVTGGDILSGTTYEITPSISFSGTDETSGLDGMKTIWLTGDGSGFSSIVGGTGVGSEGATTAANCETALNNVEIYTTGSLVMPDEGILTLCAQSFDVAGNASAVSSKTLTLKSQSIIYTEGFNIIKEDCNDPTNQYKCIYSAKDGEEITLHGTLLADPLTAPSNIQVCLNFHGVDSNKYPVCATARTSASSTTDYTFTIPTSALPATQELFISTSMTTIDLSANDANQPSTRRTRSVAPTATSNAHTQPLYLTLFVKRDTPPIVKQTKKNTYIFMRNGRLN